MNTELRIRNTRERKQTSPRAKRAISSPLYAIRYTLNASSGFTILFAVLIGSILVSLGLFIANLSIREVVLSSAGKQSETAFFAADTGIECALYWDYRIGASETVFPRSNDEDGYDTIECAGDDSIAVTALSATAAAATSTFTLSFSPAGCAYVTVGKTLAGSTVIEARGRSECGSGINPSRVERALRVRY